MIDFETDPELLNELLFNSSEPFGGANDARKISFEARSKGYTISCFTRKTELDDSDNELSHSDTIYLLEDDLDNKAEDVSVD